VKPLSDMNLGDRVWEAKPWDGKVVPRCIATETVLTVWDTVLERVEFGFPKRTLGVGAGVLGTTVRLTSENWGTTFFDNRADARRACAEQAVKLKAERNAQIAKEIAELQQHLLDVG
jgi:hypothetical protein